MDKAEQKSIEWQKAHNPMAIGGGNFADVVDAYNVNPAFVAGYKEAEKDLALTWEDMKKLDHIMNAVESENVRAIERGKDIPFDGDSGFYGEVLRRFNEQKNK